MASGVKMAKLPPGIKPCSTTTAGKAAQDAAKGMQRGYIKPSIPGGGGSGKRGE